MGGGRAGATLELLRRLVRPRRTIWPTRDGWWCLAVIMALGVAAINTGNNLLYLLVALLLGLIIVSGVLSEQAMRGVRITLLLPDEIYAGRPALVGARLVNTKRRLRSYSLAVEAVAASAAPRRLYVPHLEAGGERLVHWEETPARRGRQALGSVRLTTRFPFGLFLKAAQPTRPDGVVVYPALHPLAPEQRRQLEGVGEVATRRRGRGADLHNFRGYRPGDDPRLIHWRSTAKTGALTVRELSADTTEDLRLVLVDGGSRDPRALEAGLSEAASLAAHALRRGTRVEVAGPGLLVPLGGGRGQRARVLSALALYEPDRPAGAPGGAGARPADSRLREIRVRIG